MSFIYVFCYLVILESWIRNTKLLTRKSSSKILHSAITRKAGLVLENHALVTKMRAKEFFF